MTEAASSFEGLLREALSPVEPPDELQEWELSAMRDPRNWARPATAVVAGGAAGTALVLLRARRRAHVDVSRSGVLGGTRDTAERALKDLRRETRRLLGGR
jgi:hypothetical protein